MQSLKFNEMWIIVDQYSLKFDCDISECYLCVVCKEVLRNPKQVSCGCRLCALCLNDQIINGSSCCPGDSEECRQQVFSSDMLSQDDHFANKEICKLMMKCVFDGCNVRECFRKMCEHVTVCDLSSEMCTRCGNRIKLNEMEKHLDEECSESLIDCCYCNHQFSRKLMINMHHNIEGNSLCELYKSMCPYECDINEAVFVKQHLRVCINRPLSCPFKELGCGTDLIPKNMMERHLCQEGYRHATVLLQTISNLENEVNRLEATANDGNEKVLILDDEIRRLKNENESMQCNIGNQENNNMSTDHNEVMSMIMNLTRRMDLYDLKYEKRCFEYIWRITNFKALLKQSKIDINKHVVSDHFFTTRNGYRVQMLLYVNGLGDARGHYISLYYQLCVGKFDDILKWPFKHNVELRLLDQGGTQDQVVNLFYDPTDEHMLANYQRPPISNDVLLFGSHLFVSHATLNQIPTLKRNDTLFVQFSATPVNIID